MACFSQFMCLSDLHADGDYRLIMVDLKKLRRLRKINPQTTSAKALKDEGFTAEEVPATTTGGRGRTSGVRSR